jgi:hypothetical protein
MINLRSNCQDTMINIAFYLLAAFVRKTQTKVSKYIKYTEQNVWLYTEGCVFEVLATLTRNLSHKTKHIETYIYTYIYTNMYIHTYIHIYIYIYIETYEKISMFWHVFYVLIYIVIYPFSIFFTCIQYLFLYVFNL